MPETVIRVKGIGKQYRLGERQQGYETLRDSIANVVKAPLRRLWGPASREARGNETVWVLRDVNFEIKKGEVVGIIGRNGAGKSTLLKILSRITDPTTGVAEVHGRIGSLLEVGTGFHPELSGRENIYLNGAILGMRRSEIDAKFDDIVRFAEVEKFIDTPVKRYSSGMYLRLAFAVAAHLEPEILLVDEVLAVGDAGFQKKCIGKMRDVASEGRTVLFVSHNMEAVSTLCTRGILISKGTVAYDGPASGAVQAYLTTLAGDMQQQGADIRFPPQPEKGAEITRLRILRPDGTPSPQHDLLEPVTLALDFEVRRPYENLVVACQIRRNDGYLIFSSGELDWHNFTTAPLLDSAPKAPGQYEARVTIPAPLLNSGTYEILAALSFPRVESVDEKRGIFFDVKEGTSFSSYLFKQRRDGLLTIPLEWHVTPLPTPRIAKATGSVAQREP